MQKGNDALSLGSLGLVKSNGSLLLGLWPNISWVEIRISSTYDIIIQNDTAASFFKSL